KIVHRDIKPSNIFLEDRGGALPWVKVLDFGAGKFSQSISSNTGITQAGELIGTWHYMAPEQAMGEEVDVRMDIYAMGSLMYEMLTGQLPFDDSNMQSFLMAKMMQPPGPIPPELEVPEGLKEIIFKALSTQPAERYPSAEAMVEALLPFAPDMVGTGTHPRQHETEPSQTPADVKPPDASKAAPEAATPAPGLAGLPQPLLIMVGLIVAIVVIALVVAVVYLVGPSA
ncbi:MAG: serine/threonine-protein kinase, partial [Myxococcota bacterium]